MFKLDILNKFLMTVGVSPMAIAVQSPYVAQVQLLRERLDDFPVADGVEVATIDSFQGREADAVIISMVHFSPTAPSGALHTFYFILPSAMKTHVVGCCFCIGTVQQPRCSGIPRG